MYLKKCQLFKYIFQTYFFGVKFFSYTFYIFCINKEHFLYTHLTIFKYMLNTFQNIFFMSTILHIYCTFFVYIRNIFYTRLTFFNYIINNFETYFVMPTFFAKTISPQRANQFQSAHSGPTGRNQPTVGRQGPVGQLQADWNPIGLRWADQGVLFLKFFYPA